MELQQLEQTQILPRYQCHKIVEALAILKVEGNVLYPADEGYSAFVVDRDFLRKVNSNVGYYVRYADGYVSWSPAKAFEEGYTRIQPTLSGAAGLTRVQVATIGRTVHYVLTEEDADKINRLRTDEPSIAQRMADWCAAIVAPGKIFGWPIGAQAHIGNWVEGGMEFPAMVVRDWSLNRSENEIAAGVAMVNLQVFLDGNDVYWATSAHEDSQNSPGTWHWPELV